MKEQKIAKKLFNTTIVYFIANFSTKILSFLLLPLYTNKLSPSDYGKVDIVFTLAQFLIPVLTLNLTAAAFRFLIDAKEKEEQTKIISTSFYSIIFNVILSLSVIIIVYFINKDQILLLGALYIITSALSAYFLQICRGIGKNKVYAFMGVVNAFLHIILNIVFVIGFIEKSFALLVSPIIASIVTSIIILLFCGIYKHLRIRAFNKKCFYALFKFAAPMIPEQLIWWFLTGFSKLYLSQIHGDATLGIYTVSAKFSDFIISLYSIFHLAWIEMAYSIYGDDNRDKVYSIAYNRIAKTMLSIVLILIPFTRIIVFRFLDESYHVGIPYMPILYIMSFINILSTYYGTGFQSSKRTNGVFVSSLLGAATNVVLSLILVPKFKVWGTISALFAANIVLLISKKLISKRFFNIKVDYRWCIIFIPVLFNILIFYHCNIWVNIITLIASIILAIILNMYIFKYIVKFIRNKKTDLSNKKERTND